MLIATETMLAMRCPECGRLEFHKLSRFAFSGSRAVQVRCLCGALKLVATARKKGELRLHINCVICEDVHVHILNNRPVWSQEVIQLHCQDTGLELGCLGPLEQIRSLLQGQKEVLELLVNEFGAQEYFRNHEIMYRVLEYIHELAEEGLLHCQCGNYNIEMDIFPDRLELQCSNCSSISVVYAETEEDLYLLREVKEIELTRSSFGFLDSLLETSNYKKNK